ncbi:invasion associated locus B family protein [Saccharibacter sp. 17.LH.SD]|uniref:invasion associated locus B family protein n=1 Tax=Saccharibacter sp. 17.LH.SD TaxID=2689393 RepID=UPI001370BF8F|nr:invasion associated locus B family protein [Saccharibacter sp. 17.LH.SD]MXV43591.1 invasion associated locus B family protein [Saccharibacter sp. 17.LH.SD]
MFRSILSLGVMSALALCVSQGAEAASSFPNGSTSLTEAYHDWSLSCHVENEKKQCVVSQQAFDSKTRQRFFSIQFRPQGEQIRGVALLPFGLDLPRGMTLITDGLPVGDIYSFTTCLPEGCVVPLDLDEGQLGGLVKSKKAALSFTSISGQVMKLPLSTNGLQQALARAHVVMR